MGAPQPARFLAPTWHEEAAAASAALTERHQREHAEHMAYTAMRAGLPSMLVDRAASKAHTLADMLSDAVCNYDTTLAGKNPAELLCTVLAEALRSTDKRVQEAAEAFATRVKAEYAEAYGVQA